MVSQELVTASQDLTHSRTKCSNVQERFDRVQTFLEKVKPFDLSIAESVFTQGNVRFDASVLHSMGPPQSGAIFKLTNQVRRLEETLREGQSAHSKILGQFDSIATDRLVKDSHFTNEIASIFQIPEDSVEGILKVCSE